jgi:antitoxin (DNA-binding transcriptional repressor) of toxin-antitoxin stability system
MIKLNVHEAKTHLSYYLQKLKRGETILLCRRNVPIAEIRALPPRRKTKRQIGLAKGNSRLSEILSPCQPILSTPFMVAVHETAFGHGDIFVGRQRCA